MSESRVLLPLIASAGFDATVRLWDFDTGSCLQVLTGHQGWIHDLQFSPDGQRLVSGGSDQPFSLSGFLLSQE